MIQDVDQVHPLTEMLRMQLYVPTAALCFRLFKWINGFLIKLIFVRARESQDLRTYR